MSRSKTLLAGLKEARRKIRQVQNDLQYARQAFFREEQKTKSLQRTVDCIANVRTEKLFQKDPDLWAVTVTIDRNIFSYSKAGKEEIVKMIALDIYAKLASQPR